MITIKSAREIALLKEAGRIVAHTHKVLAAAIKPGISTLDLDRLAEETIRSMDATPSFKGYHGFPGSICTSINNMLVHGIPDHRILHEGDIISIDIPAGRLDLMVDAAVLEERRKKLVPHECPIRTGYLYRYSKHVTSARQGAIVLED